MKFDELYNLVNEIPHIEIPNTYHVHNDSSLVDYKVELWRDVAFELKSSIVNILLDMNSTGIILDVRKTSSGPEVYVVDKHTQTPLMGHPETMQKIEAENINPEEFHFWVLQNHSIFEYY